MSNKEELRNQLIHYFKSVGSGENMIQCIKQVLFLHESFNPVAIFEKLSRGKQKISSRNWQDYLQSINLHFTQRQFRYFMKQNGYKSEVTLNEFLQSLIPYNGDVVRQYKQKCSQSIRITESNQQIDYIFATLLENQIHLFRTLINIRDSITSIATLKNIQELVKNDLLDDLQKNNLAREYRKMQETFEQKTFKLGFSELRKFFKVWVPQKVIVHELCMLNIMRHLKSNDPFCKIVFKKKRNGQKQNNSALKRSRSQSNSEQSADVSRQKKVGEIQHSPYSKHLISPDHNDKYSDYKNKILMETKKQSLFQDKKQQQKLFLSNELSPNKYRNSQYKQNKDTRQHGQIKNQNKSQQSIYALKFFEEIVVKEEALQRIRKELAKKPDFNLINLYKLIDAKNKGFVTSRDIADFPDLERGNYIHMVNFYGRQFDKLLFHEFCQIFRPLSRQLNDAIDSRPQSLIPDPFKKQTRKLILQLFKMTAQLHFNLQRMRQGMRRLNQKEMFISLDVLNKGYLDSDTLLTVFKQNNIYCDDKTLKCLMKLFRKRVDERISFSEFSKFIEA